MLQHEGGACRIADGATMSTAIRQAVHRVVCMLQIDKEVEIAIHIVQDRQVDEAFALIGHHHVIGIFRPGFACRFRACRNALLCLRFVVELLVHLELLCPAFGDDGEDWP